MELSIYTDERATHAWSVTEWYEAGQLPARSGVYDVGTEFRYFDGANWYVGAGTPNEAMRFFQVLGERTTALPWRGLTERHT